MIYGGAGVRGASPGYLNAHGNAGARRNVCFRFPRWGGGRLEGGTLCVFCDGAVGFVSSPNLCICFACVAVFAFDAVFTGGAGLQSA